MQTAIGVDRSLPRNMTLSVNFINTRGVHQFQTVDINTPVIGTYPALGNLGFIRSVRRRVYTTCTSRAASSSRIN